jgi:type II secretory pathway component GspD/PulD (secretin)
VDMSPETSKKLGFLYDWTPLSFTETKTGGNVSFGSLARSAFGFNVELQAAEERREAKILARPNIAVIDGEEASIFIGDLFRYERVTSVSDSGQQVFTIETVPIGVALLCRPRVTGDEITLRVHPVVSNIRTFTGRNKDIPVTSSREAESVVRMKDGETFAIGGLLKDEELKIMTKVPILGDLPFLGQLFRHRDTSKKRSEVTIFITARIRKD